VVVVIALALLAIGTVLLGVRYLPVLDDVRDARQSSRELSNQARALKPAELNQVALDRLRASLRGLDEDLEPLRALVKDDPLVAVAARLPGLDTQLGAVDALVGAADALVEAGDIGLGLADGVVELREANEADPSFSLMPGLVALMATSGDEVDRLEALIDAAGAELDRIPDATLGQIREARDLIAEPLAEYAPLLRSYARYDDVLPGLLGWGDEKRYLVLAQNPAELRPSGGYAGTIGVLGLRDGAIVEQAFRDVHELSRQPGLPFIEAPDELSAYLLGEEQSWRLADANWAADFPVAAQKALELYEIESGDSDIDGVIAITTYALDRLLEVTGPVAVPQYDVVVEPGDVTLTLLGATRGSPKSVEGRKEVLDVLARRLIARLLALPPQRWVATSEAIDDIGSQQLALAWFKDEAAQALVDDADWDGRVRQEPGDYVYVVESNVSPTSKYNLVVDRSDALVVKLDEDGSALDSLRLDWQNDAGKDGEPYRSLRSFSNNEEGWYGAYVRVLTPAGSELVTASGAASDEIRGVERTGTEAGRSSFANYLFMPPGESTLTYLWTVPEAAVETDEGWVYELVVQKQPGARSLPLSVRLDLPEGATVTEHSDGARVDGSRVTYQADLDQDRTLRVVYELEPDD
jgi:hypothetical protein